MDDTTEENLVIESVKSDGQRFRPSGWIERISASLATFGTDHRLHYATEVQPCIIDGQKYLAVSKHLRSNNPAAYNEICVLHAIMICAFRSVDGKKRYRSGMSGESANPPPAFFA